MFFDDDPLADDLRAFSEARDAAQHDQDEARKEQRLSDNRLIAEAPAAFTDLHSKLVQRVKRLASSYGERNVECHPVGNTTTIRLGIFEANVQFRPGRPSDAFGPLLPVVSLRLSRTSQTIGYDVMPPGMSDYRPQTPRSEEFGLLLTRDGTAWSTPSGAKTSSDLVEHAVSELVQYFKSNLPR